MQIEAPLHFSGSHVFKVRSVLLDGQGKLVFSFWFFRLLTCLHIIHDIAIV